MSRYLQNVICTVLILLGLLLVTPTSIRAQSSEYVTPVFIITGSHNWPLAPDTPDSTTHQLQSLALTSQIPTTWLLSYDALTDKKITAAIPSETSTLELGVFIEITPKLLEHVWHTKLGPYDWRNEYRQLSYHSLLNRQLIIDEAVNRFVAKYGHFPSSLGAWHIDAESASYATKKYQIQTILMPTDSLTSTFETTGGWLSPYYPSPKHILIPATDPGNKLPLIVAPWRLPDISSLSTRTTDYQPSLLASDYVRLKKNLDHFKQLLGVYLNPSPSTFAYASVGVSNTELTPKVFAELQQQFSYLRSLHEQQQITVTTLSDFSHFYRHQFPQVSAPIRFETTTVGITETAITNWEFTPQHRSAILQHSGGTKVIEFRDYIVGFPEPYLTTENPFPQTNISVPDISAFPSATDRQLAANNYVSTPKWLPVIIFFIAGIIATWLLLPNIYITVLIILLSCFWMGTMFKNALPASYGHGYWGPHGHDAVWHLGISRHFSQGLSLDNPVFSDTELRNYHYLFNILLGGMHKLTGIALPVLYFQIIPFLMALAIGIVVYHLMIIWTERRLAAVVGVILTYVGGSAGWVVNLIRHGTLSGESMFWAQQSISTLVNPPYTLSLIFMLAGFIFFLKTLNEYRIRYFIAAVFFWSLLAQTKVYASILTISGLAAAILLIQIPRFYKPYPQLKLKFSKPARRILSWHFLAKIKLNNPYQLLLAVFACVIIASVFLTVPFAKGVSKVFIISPFWFIHTMMGAHDRIDWYKLDEARLTFAASGRTFKWLLTELLGLGIFVLGNLWTRVIGAIFVTGKIAFLLVKNRHAHLTDVMLTPIIAMSWLIPLIFIQQGTAWNTIQFLYYGLFFLNLYTARALSSMYEHFKYRTISIALILTVIALNIPTNIGTLREYLPQTPPSRVPAEEILALNLLSQMPRGNVLTYPHGRDNLEFHAPHPLRDYASTAYVTAYSGQPTVLSDQVNLEIIAANWRPRLQHLHDFFATNSEQYAKEFLRVYNVKYLYLLKGQTMNQKPESLGFQKIFDNGLAFIYIKS